MRDDCVQREFTRFFDKFYKNSKSSKASKTILNDLRVFSTKISNNFPIQDVPNTDKDGSMDLTWGKATDSTVFL